MNEYIAYCGLDCEACEARLATVNNDDVMRQRVAREWSDLNGVEITPEMNACEKLAMITGNNADTLRRLKEECNDNKK